MKRLIKENGMAINKINKLPGDTVIVYHGTSAAFIDSIKQNGLTQNTDNSYQKSGVNYGEGIWVTLNEQAARGYAIDSAKGFMKDNENSEDEEITQYFGYGAIISFEVAKDSLNDELSASVNNLKSNEPITPDKIRNIKIFDINSGKEWIAIVNPKMNKMAYHTNKQTKQWIDDRVKLLQKSNPDMSNDMAYGIAWQQFKKKHPSWESKKTAEFVDGYECEDSFGEKMQVEVYINPTGKEISDCKNNQYKAIRGVINNGVEYCWRGDVLHDQIKGVNVDEFRFAYEDDPGYLGWTFDAHHKYSLLELCKLIKDNANRLSKYGNLESEIFVCGTSSSHGEEYDMRKYEQVIDYIKNNESKKVARLIKKAEYLHCHNCHWDNGDYSRDDNGKLYDWVPDTNTKKFKKLYKNQVYKSRKEYEEKNPEHICPMCGKQELDTD